MISNCIKLSFISLFFIFLLFFSISEQSTIFFYFFYLRRICFQIYKRIFHFKIGFVFLGFLCVPRHCDGKKNHCQKYPSHLSPFSIPVDLSAPAPPLPGLRPGISGRREPFILKITASQSACIHPLRDKVLRFHSYNVTCPGPFPPPTLFHPVFR